MEQVKFFFAGISRTGVELEPNINQWLHDKGDAIRITRVAHTGNRDFVSVGIYYEPVGPAPEVA